MKKTFIGLTGLLLMIAGQAWAAGEPSTTMDDMVVTGSRLAQKIEKIPAQITVITAADIEARGAQSVPDALRNLGGVTVTDLNGNGFNQKVDMGGFGGTADRHVAVVVNGRKINPMDLSGTNFLSIPIENVARIEVLHGGSSVLYGGDAMGGVINIITKDAKAGVHGHVEAGFGSHDTTKGTAGISFAQGRFDGNFGAVLYNTDGYRDHSEGDRSSIYGKFTFHASDTLALTLEANTTEADYEFPGPLTKDQMRQDRKQATNPEDEYETRDTFYALTLESNLGDMGKFDLNLSYRDYSNDAEMPSFYSDNYATYDYETVGVNPQYILDRSFFGKENRLTVGVEFYDSKYERWSGNTKATIKTNNYDHDQKTWGLYLQDEFNLTQNLVVNLGTRYEEFDTTLRSSKADDNDLDESEWAWNLGVAYIFKPGSKIYARSYKAFRFPRVDEFMILSTGVVNTDLKHETSQGYEIGARFVGMDNRLSMNARLFTFDVEDEIFWNNAVWKNDNIGETRHQGGEIDARFRTTDIVTLFGGLGYTDAEITTGDNDGKEIPMVPEFKANTGFELNFACGFTYRLQYNYLSSRHAGSDTSNEFDKLDSASTVDMYATYTYKQVELFLNATNIFNEEYYDGYKSNWGESFYPMPEAVYYGGIRVRF
jgi:iron complex outermembrane receptor protein